MIFWNDLSSSFQNFRNYRWENGTKGRNLIEKGVVFLEKLNLRDLFKEFSMIYFRNLNVLKWGF